MSRTDMFLNAIERASAPWIQAMLRATLEGALVLVLLWLLPRLLRRIPTSVQCWLWRAAYGKLLVSLLVAGAITLHVLPAGLAADQSHRSTSLETAQAQSPTASQARSRMTDITDSRAATSFVDARSIPTRTTITLRQIVSACFVAWCIGVLVCIARIAGACRRARRLRCNSSPLSDTSSINSLRRVCRSAAIDHPPELLVSSEIDSPLLVGICRPAVLVPVELIAQISTLEFRAMLAHEIEHMRRHDLLWNWLAAITNVLFFFHPCVWLARRELALTCEAACDAAAVTRTGTSVGTYLAMLLKIASDRRELPNVGFAAASIVESYKTLQRRFLTMKSITVQSARRRAIWSIVAIVLGIIGMLPWRVVPRAAAQTVRPAAPSAIDAPSTRPADELRWRIKSVSDLKGKWIGEKDGVGVELKFDDTRPGNFPATWIVSFTRSSEPQQPGQTPVTEVRKGADLRCKLDEKRRGLNLYLPAYLGDDKARKESSWNGKTPVAEIRRSDEDALELRIIPTGCENPSAQDYDFPAVDHLILRRVAPATEPAREQ